MRDGLCPGLVVGLVVGRKASIDGFSFLQSNPVLS